MKEQQRKLVASRRGLAWYQRIAYIFESETVTDCTETSEQWQCNAKHEGATRAHPGN